MGNITKMKELLKDMNFFYIRESMGSYFYEKKIISESKVIRCKTFNELNPSSEDLEYISLSEPIQATYNAMRKPKQISTCVIETTIYLMVKKINNSINLYAYTSYINKNRYEIKIMGKIEEFGKLYTFIDEMYDKMYDYLQLRCKQAEKENVRPSLKREIKSYNQRLITLKSYLTKMRKKHK